MTGDAIYVTISLNGADHPVGTIWRFYHSRKERVSFEYDEAWLKNPQKFALEPALALFPGPIRTELSLGAIGDSAPDKWGRTLMKRYENIRSLQAGETPRTLNDSDYLLLVSDETRQGALRFSRNKGGPYLSQPDETPVPPLIDLAKLLSVTEKYLDEEETAEDLHILFAPGSSLGGARPKASVRDYEGNLSIAKFPKKDDPFDIVRWEAVALELARRAGLNVAQSKLEIVLNKPILLLKRFDRQDGKRIPFLSAMSMIGSRDGQDHSYLELADAISQHGATPDADRRELWRRVVFGVLITNTDDHMRNHGFLYEGAKGWVLSPAYDMNPMPITEKARILTTSITYDDPRASLDPAFEFAEYLGIPKDEALATIKQVAQATATWRDVATRFGISSSAQERMVTAFEHDESKKAEAL